MRRRRSHDRSGSGPRAADEQGQTAVLIIGFTLVVVLTVAVVVDASVAFLRRQALDTLADGTALAAADAVGEERVYTSGLADRVVLDAGLARAEARAYLGSVAGRRRFPGLHHTVTTRDGRVVVRLSAPLDLPFAIPGVSQQVRVTATAAATVATTG